MAEPRGSAQCRNPQDAATAAMYCVVGGQEDFEHWRFWNLSEYLCFFCSVRGSGAEASGSSRLALSLPENPDAVSWRGCQCIMLGFSEHLLVFLVTVGLNLAASYMIRSRYGQCVCVGYGLLPAPNLHPKHQRGLLTITAAVVNRP